MFIYPYVTKGILASRNNCFTSGRTPFRNQRKSSNRSARKEPLLQRGAGREREDVVRPAHADEPRRAARPHDLRLAAVHAAPTAEGLGAVGGSELRDGRRAGSAGSDPVRRRGRPQKGPVASECDAVRLSGEAVLRHLRLRPLREARRLPRLALRGPLRPRLPRARGARPDRARPPASQRLGEPRGRMYIHLYLFIHSVTICTLYRYICIHVCMYICICMYVYIHIYIYIYV